MPKYKSRHYILLKKSRPPRFSGAGCVYWVYKLGYISKSVSGSNIGVYKLPRALYTNMTQSFIYFETFMARHVRVNEWIVNHMTENNELMRLGMEENLWVDIIEELVKSVSLITALDQ